MSRFWSPVLKQLHPYVPGEQSNQPDLIKLNTNENPYPPSPDVARALASIKLERLRLYPDPDAKALKQAIADYYQLNLKQVFVGNGSDEVLAHCFKALFDPSRPILFPDISYSFYPVYCGLFELEANTIALNKNFEINIADYQQDCGGIIFPNPNAPTGRLLALDAIESLLQQHPNSVVVVDEAYIDFGGESAACLVQKYENLLVIQTMSKSRSLAGLRIGFALGHADLIEGLERVKNSFNSYPMDTCAIAAGVAAMQDQAYFKQSCQQVMDSREYLTQGLKSLGFDVIPSAANFVFVTHQQRSALQLYRALRESNIMVRHFDKPKINNHLRITVGTQAECETLLEQLKLILS